MYAPSLFAVALLGHSISVSAHGYLKSISVNGGASYLAWQVGQGNTFVLFFASRSADPAKTTMSRLNQRATPVALKTMVLCQTSQARTLRAMSVETLQPRAPYPSTLVTKCTCCSFQ
jgi:hypothetical protein